MQKPTEISRSLLTSKNPTKRHCCRRDSSLVWFNSGKRKPVKEYRCNELDEYARKTDSSNDFHTMEASKHVQQENAIVGDFEAELQEQGEVQGITTSRAKRIRWIYLPENANSLENSVLLPESLEFPPFPSTEDKSSLEHCLAAEKYASKTTECDSSASNLEDSDRDQVFYPSGVAKRKKLKLKRELKTHNGQQKFKFQDKNRDGMNRKTVEYLDFEVEELHQSAFAGNGFEVTSSYLDPMDIDQQDVIETALVDVRLTIKASHRAENVPFVCLTSASHGIAILGHPLEIGEIADGSEALLPSNGRVAHKLFGDRGSQFHQLVWRTSKRTPVCYITNSLSSIVSKNVQAGQASENVEDSIPPARENGVRIKEKSLMKLLMNPKQVNRGKTALRQTCVPVELVFSKILTAVS